MWRLDVTIERCLITCQISALWLRCKQQHKHLQSSSCRHSVTGTKLAAIEYLYFSPSTTLRARRKLGEKKPSCQRDHAKGRRGPTHPSEGLVWLRRHGPHDWCSTALRRAEREPCTKVPSGSTTDGPISQVTAVGLAGCLFDWVEKLARKISWCVLATAMR